MVQANFCQAYALDLNKERIELEAVLTKETTRQPASDLLQGADLQKSQDYRDAMALLGGAVNIVTSDGAAGKVGFAATAVCSVSDRPPTLLVCTNRSSSSYRPIIQNAVICVNTLASTSQDLAQVFGGQKGHVADRFAFGSWVKGETGAPVLLDSIAAFDCRLVNAYENGTHDIFICEVVKSYSQPDRDGLFYYKRDYRHIAD